MFAFYYRNREFHKKVADIGANIGLHSIVLSKCGFEVEDTNLIHLMPQGSEII